MPNVTVKQASSQPSLGDVDTDVVEMTLYDDYRMLDGKSYSNSYLYECRKTLMEKTKETQLHKLDNRVKLESKEENERIRNLIAFGLGDWFALEWVLL